MINSSSAQIKALQSLLDLGLAGGGGHILGVDQDGILGGIGADFLVLVGPGVGLAGQGVAVLDQGQLGEVLLAELQGLVGLGLVGLIDVLVAVLVNGLGLGAGGDDNVADSDDGLGVILNHGGLQGVQSEQASLFTGNDLVAVESLDQAVVQAIAQSQLGNGNGPVAAGEALDVAVITQGAQQHLHEVVAGQGSSGTEGAVSIAVDDALLRAVSDVAGEHVVGGNILKGSGVSGQSGGGGGAQDQVADDLGSLTTIQGVLGLEGAVSVTIDDTDCGHHVDSFLIGDAVIIREVRGTSADGDQRHGHNQSQYQRKELLHLGFPPFEFTGFPALMLWSIIFLRSPGAHTVASQYPYLYRLSVERWCSTFCILANPQTDCKGFAKLVI